MSHSHGFYSNYGPFKGCDARNALVADGQYAGLSLPDNVRADGTTYAVWEQHAVTSCIEIDFGREREANGVRYLASGSDEAVCDDACAAEGCGTEGHMLVYISDASHSPGDYTTFELAGEVTLELDDTPGDGIAGAALWDELTWDPKPVQYIGATSAQRAFYNCAPMSLCQAAEQAQIYFLN
eukprot:SAG11_NODE_1798_length_4246_cov_1.709670_2_plen_182_part_00